VVTLVLVGVGLSEGHDRAIESSPEPR
jgi:hypothetical protein